MKKILSSIGAMIIIVIIASKSLLGRSNFIDPIIDEIAEGIGDHIDVQQTQTAEVMQRTSSVYEKTDLVEQQTRENDLRKARITEIALQATRDQEAGYLTATERVWKSTEEQVKFNNMITATKVVYDEELKDVENRRKDFALASGVFIGGVAVIGTLLLLAGLIRVLNKVAAKGIVINVTQKEQRPVEVPVKKLPSNCVDVCAKDTTPRLQAAQPVAPVQARRTAQTSRRHGHKVERLPPIEISHPIHKGRRLLPSVDVEQLEKQIEYEFASDDEYGLPWAG